MSQDLLWHLLAVAIPGTAAVWQMSARLTKIETILGQLMQKIEKLEPCAVDIARLSERMIKAETKLSL